jgi:hypothetical protein
MVVAMRRLLIAGICVVAGFLNTPVHATDNFPPAAIEWLKSRYATAQPLTSLDWRELLHNWFDKTDNQGTCNPHIADIFYRNNLSPPDGICYSKFVKRFQSETMPAIKHIWALTKFNQATNETVFRGICLVVGKDVEPTDVIGKTRNFLGAWGVRCIDWHTGEILAAHIIEPVLIPGFPYDYLLEPTTPSG